MPAQKKAKGTRKRGLRFLQGEGGNGGGRMPGKFVSELLPGREEKA